MKILHLEDNVHDAEVIRHLVTAEWPDCEIALCSGPEECREILSRQTYDLILSDISMPRFKGMEALTLAREYAPQTPFIFLSEAVGDERAIEALRAGAADYIPKDRIPRLVASIRRTLDEHRERRRAAVAERRIREQAEMLDQAHDAIVITDLDGRILSWNAGAGALFGWTAEEVLGKTGRELFAGDAGVRVQLANLETATRNAWRGELQLHDKHGRAVVVEMRRSLIRDETGRAKAHLSISTDITERKRLEDQLLHAQRMQNIGLLAAGIAHDLNNVLAPILMAAPMLRERMSDAADKQMLTMLERSAERGAGLVRQILAFAHGAAGQPQAVGVKHLVNDITFIVAETFPKNIRFEKRIAADLWPIQANPIQIHQVLLNLCVNARDAMPQGGLLSIRAENCTVGGEDHPTPEAGWPGEFALIRVEDTGPGIPPEVQAHMWRPFFTTKEKGTGLGLSTVRGIVDSHHGFITVDTGPGRGTCFHLYLPAAQAAPAPAVTPIAAVAPRGNGELVLVVDDEQHVRDLASTVLTRAGYRVLSVGDGAEAVSLFAQRKGEVSLVISDTHMPGLDGPMLARALRQIDPSVRILAISGLSRGDDSAPEAIDPIEYAAGFLRKPFKPDSLVSAVFKLITSPKQ